MLHKKNKRKLSNLQSPPKKRFKPCSIVKPTLYINDRNTTAADIQQLKYIGIKRASNILSEIRKEPFKSVNDIIQRIPRITKQSITQSPVIINYQTRRQEQEEIICNVLQNIPWIKQTCSDLNILKEIATQSIGEIKKCDRENCNGTILLVNHDQTHNYPAETPYLSHEKEYIFNEEFHDEIYYHRKHKQLGNVTYCKPCTEQIRHCACCHQKAFFHKTKGSYNICPGQHCYKLQENDPHSIRKFQFKMCRECTVCYYHMLSTNLIVEHEYGNTNTEFQ